MRLEELNQDCLNFLTIRMLFDDLFHVTIRASVNASRGVPPAHITRDSNRLEELNLDSWNFFQKLPNSSYAARLPILFSHLASANASGGVPPAPWTS